jgi:F-type H+-transporting ATPase subunit b
MREGALSLIRVARRLTTAWALALLVIGGALGVRVYAQGAPAPSQNQSESDQNFTPGRQLAHETREAAGEEKDENAEFKQSAAVRWIGQHTGLNPRQSYWLCVLLNFVVIAALIVWAWNKRVPAMFSSRTADIQTAMLEARRASEEARRKLADVEARLSRIDVEINAMRDEAATEAAAEEARIKAAAEEEARNIVSGAQQEIAAAARAARRQLAAHAADLAVGLAQKHIRIDSGTDQALVRNFANQLAVTPDDIGKDGR